ncbi:MAG: MFS transporter [Candidatus Bathyarchaeota archaeon]|nr:MAG: MFS transporter [Candidatus Bathyarchaeota archaeon]
MNKLRSIFGFIQGNTLVLIVADILSRFGVYGLVWPYFSLYVMALGGSPIIVGFVYSVGVLAGFPTFPIGGYISDHSGRVKLVGIMTYLESFIFVFFIFANNWIIMIIGLFLWQMIAIHYPVLQAIMADSLPPGKRGIGFATAMALPSITGFIAPYISGYLIDIYGGGFTGVRVAMPICWTISLIIGLVVATIRIRLLTETLEKAESRISLKNIPFLLKASYKSVLDSIKWMPNSLRAIAIVSIVITFFVSIAGPFWIIYATSILGLKASSWGVLILVLGQVQIGLSIPMGHLVDRYGARRLIILALFLSIFPTFFFIFCRTFIEIILTLLTLTCANAILWPAFSTVKANLIPRERRGRLLSILGHGGGAISWSGTWATGVILFIPMSVGMLIVGYIYESNPKYPWIILTVAIILCLILTIQFIHEPEKPEI